jgi:hypothetical protein
VKHTRAHAALTGRWRAQRLALARAVYADADVYLLVGHALLLPRPRRVLLQPAVAPQDDPLSAVDNIVASWLFKHVLGLAGEAAASVHACSGGGRALADGLCSHPSSPRQACCGTRRE